MARALDAQQLRTARTRHTAGQGLRRFPSQGSPVVPARRSALARAGADVSRISVPPTRHGQAELHRDQPSHWARRRSRREMGSPRRGPGSGHCGNPAGASHQPAGSPASFPGRRRASPRHARSANRRRGLPRSRQPRQGPPGDLDRHAAPKRGGGDRLHPCGSGVATLLYAIPRAFLVLSAAAMLVACGTSSPGGNPYPGAERPVNPQPTDPPAAAAPAHGGPPPEASAPTSAALNLRLLEKVSPSAGDGDLPVGPGDLIEISVFEVEELSKLRLRIPARGVISVPLIGHIQAAGHTATELENEIR